MHYTTRFQVGRMIDLHFRGLRLDVSRVWLFEVPEDLLAMVAAGHGWTVATPSQIFRMAEAEPALPALPGPALSRGITLVAGAQELGDLPAQLAALSRQRLRQDHAPAIAALLPNLPGSYTVIADPKA